MSIAHKIVRMAQSKRKASVAAILGGSLCAVGCLTAALARDDSGQHMFFGESAPQLFKASAVDFRGTSAPELTIRPRRVFEVKGYRPAHYAARHGARGEKTGALAQGPVRVPLPPTRLAKGNGENGLPSLIFNDKTLKRGDVVMFDQGLRVFAGSHAFPHGPTDFTPVDSALGMKSQFRKILVEIARSYDRRV